MCSHMTPHMLPHVNTLYCTLACTRVCRWGELQAYGWAATSLLIHALDPKALEQLRPALAAAAARKDASACIIGMAQRLSRELTPVGQHLAAHVLTSCTVPGARGGGFPSYLHPHPHPIFSMLQSLSLQPANTVVCVHLEHDCRSSLVGYAVFNPSLCACARRPPPYPGLLARRLSSILRRPPPLTDARRTAILASPAHLVNVPQPKGVYTRRGNCRNVVWPWRWKW